MSDMQKYIDTFETRYMTEAVTQATKEYVAQIHAILGPNTGNVTVCSSLESFTFTTNNYSKYLHYV